MKKLLQIINSGEYEKIEGWCTKEKAIKMAELITDDTKLCVELGVFGGRSLLPLGIMCKGDVLPTPCTTKVKLQEECPIYINIIM